MGFIEFLDVVVVVWVLWRQRRTRPVRFRPHLGADIFLVVIGVLAFEHQLNGHHLSGDAVAILAGSLLVAASAFGALRAATVRLWPVENWVVGRGTWVTMTLWAVSLIGHFAAGWAITRRGGPSGLDWASLLLYLGITLGVQNVVLTRRAVSLRRAAGPIDAWSETVSVWAETMGPSGGTGSTTKTEPPVIEARSWESDEQADTDEGPGERPAGR